MRLLGSNKAIDGRWWQLRDRTLFKDAAHELYEPFPVLLGRNAWYGFVAVPDRFQSILELLSDSMIVVNQV